MPEDVAIALALQIEVRMIGQIQHSIFIGGRRILNAQGTATQGVSHSRRERARKTLLPILAHVGKFDSIRDLFRRPHHLVEAADATMKRVVAVILWNGIGMTVELEVAMRDAICVAADDASEMRSLRYVLLDRIDTQNHIVELSLSIGRAQRNNDPSVSDDADFDLAIRQRVEIDSSSLRCTPKRLLVNRSLR